MTPMRVTIAEEVRAYMGRRRVSAVQLGRTIGKSQSYMSRRLTGETAFDIDDLEAIARALDVSIPDLLGTTGRKTVDSRAHAPIAA